MLHPNKKQRWNLKKRTITVQKNEFLGPAYALWPYFFNTNKWNSSFRFHALLLLKTNSSTAGSAYVGFNISTKFTFQNFFYPEEKNQNQNQNKHRLPLDRWRR